MDQIQKLWKLQQIDLRRKELEEVKESNLRIKDIHDLKVNTDKLRDDLQKLKERSKDCAKKIKLYEDNIDTLTKQNKDYKDEMYGGEQNNSKELTKLQQKVDELAIEVNLIEDKWTEAGEEVELLNKEIEDKENELKKLSANLEQHIKQHKKDQEIYQKEVKSVENMRKELEQQIDKDMLKRYNQKRMKNRNLVALVNNGSCTGCNMGLSFIKQREVKKAETIETCDYCERILMIKN